MSLRVFLFASLNIVFSYSMGQGGFPLAWGQELGGTSLDEGTGICEAPFGYWLIGSTSSPDPVYALGGYDLWLLAMDHSGTIVQQRRMGGSFADHGMGIAPMSDGGAVLVGYSNSSNGDLLENQGGLDLWVIRVDAQGEIVWQHTYGGSGWDAGFCITALADGGVAVAGRTNSTDGDVIGQHGSGTVSDLWVLRLDAAGELVWQRTMGGTDSELGYSIDEDPNGRIWVVGEARSTNGDVLYIADGIDAWVCVLEPDGTTRWTRTYGGSENDYAYNVLAHPDGGAIIAGSTRSNDGDVYGQHGQTDAWVLRVSDTGGLLWQRSLGGAANDRAQFIQPVSGGKWLVLGYASSMNGNVSTWLGGEDAWAVLLRDNGELLWDASYGGSGNDRFSSAIPSSDGGIYVLGRTSSTDGDVQQAFGGHDLWLVRLDDATRIAEQDPVHVQIGPVPASDMLYVTSTEPLNELLICSLEGRVIGRHTLSGTTTMIDVQDLAEGTYITRTSGDGWTNTRLVLVAR